MMTFVNVNIRHWRYQFFLTLVGGQVFTRSIEHIFENSVMLMMWEVLV
jgi:hypothetical protein